MKKVKESDELRQEYKREDLGKESAASILRLTKKALT
jgi:hypothetical protein